MKIILALSLMAMGADKPEKESVDVVEPMICSTDVKSCSDGSFVSRDPLKGCEFKACASESKEKLKKPKPSGD